MFVGFLMLATNSGLWQRSFLAKNLGARGDYIEHNESSEKNGHPCPKPIGFVIRWIDRVAHNANSICDPFMGSGTTGVACARLGRRFIGIEIEPKYFDIACKRIAAGVCAAEAIPDGGEARGGPDGIRQMTTLPAVRTSPLQALVPARSSPYHHDARELVAFLDTRGGLTPDTLQAYYQHGEATEEEVRDAAYDAYAAYDAAYAAYAAAYAAQQKVDGGQT